MFQRDPLQDQLADNLHKDIHKLKPLRQLEISFNAAEEWFGGDIESSQFKSDLKHTVSRLKTTVMEALSVTPNHYNIHCFFAAYKIDDHEIK